MGKVREVLRLKYALSMSAREIGRSCSLSHATVREYVKRAEAGGLSWPLDEKWNDAELEKLLFGARRPFGSDRKSRKHEPDFAEIRKRLSDCGSLTLRNLWEEWENVHPNIYSYSRYCALYQRWRDGQDYRSGGKLVVYWADETVPICDRQSGVVHGEASIFAGVCPASNYTFLHATPNRTMYHWIAGHDRAIEFMGGVPIAVIFDKRSVDRALHYEPDINRTYQELAEHFGTSVTPATERARRRESGIGKIIKTGHAPVIAALRNEKFSSIAELNDAISEFLDWLNIQPYEHGESRRVLFEALDFPALGALPNEPYNYAEWKKCRVSVDYHVEIDGHYYSVPFILAGQLLDARCTTLAIEIFERGTRVAFHRRSFVRHQHTTLDCHMPSGHLAHLAWSPAKLIDWANHIGDSTGGLILAILNGRPHPEMGYRACMGVLRFAKTYGPERLEAACRCALQRRLSSYQSVRSILRQMANQCLTNSDKPSGENPLAEPGLGKKGSGSVGIHEQTSLFERMVG